MQISLSELTEYNKVARNSALSSVLGLFRAPSANESAVEDVEPIEKMDAEQVPPAKKAAHDDSSVPMASRERIIELNSQLAAHMASVWKTMDLPKSDFEPFKAVLRVEFHPDGRIFDVSIITRSGNREFDLLAVKAVNTAGQFQPLKALNRNDFYRHFYIREFVFK